MTRVNVNQAKPVLKLKGRRTKGESTRPAVQKVQKVQKDQKVQRVQKVTKLAPRARKRAEPREQPVHRERTDSEVLAELREEAPDLWQAEAPAPLAVGIHKQLYPVAERLQMSRKALRKFLSRWTSAKAYQQALTQPGAERFNLDGSSAGVVQQQHQDRARERVSASA